MELAWPQPMLSVKVSFWLTDTTSPDSGAMRIVPRSHLSNELPPSYGAAVGPRGKDVDTGAGGMKDSMVIGRGVLATGEPEGAIDLAVKAGSGTPAGLVSVAVSGTTVFTREGGWPPW